MNTWISLENYVTDRKKNSSFDLQFQFFFSFLYVTMSRMVSLFLSLSLEISKNVRNIYYQKRRKSSTEWFGISYMKKENRTMQQCFENDNFSYGNCPAMKNGNNKIELLKCFENQLNSLEHDDGRFVPFIAQFCQALLSTVTINLNHKTVFFAGLLIICTIRRCTTFHQLFVEWNGKRWEIANEF